MPSCRLLTPVIWNEFGMDGCFHPFFLFGKNGAEEVKMFKNQLRKLLNSNFTTSFI